MLEEGKSSMLSQSRHDNPSMHGSFFVNPAVSFPDGSGKDRGAAASGRQESSGAGAGGGGQGNKDFDMMTAQVTTSLVLVTYILRYLSNELIVVLSLTMPGCNTFRC